MLDESYKYRKSKSGLLIAHKDEREFIRTPKTAGCCNLHYMPTDGRRCDEIIEHNGGGILIPCCGNCWYYNDNSLKYNKL